MSTEQFVEVALKGVHYNPANFRYGKDQIVMCDMCKKTGLNACVGYEDLDLCLGCYDIIIAKTTTQLNDEKIITNMRQGQFNSRNKHVVEPSRTRMMQEQFNVTRTKMMQDQYFTKMQQNLFNDKPCTKMQQNIFSDAWNTIKSFFY